jgi:ABC-2 type transport system ATP-binding protein
VDVQDMEIRRPDLEDVFLQVMSGAGTGNAAAVTQGAAA